MAYTMKDDNAKVVKASEVPSPIVEDKVNPVPEPTSQEEAVINKDNESWERSTTESVARSNEEKEAELLNKLHDLGLAVREPKNEEEEEFTKQAKQMTVKSRLENQFKEDKQRLAAREGTSIDELKKQYPLTPNEAMQYASKEHIDLVNMTVINIKKHGGAIELISDGYHTFKELYEFRKLLLANWFYAIYWTHNQSGSLTVPLWRSKLHSDGTMFDKYFIVGYQFKEGYQISFHFEEKDWELFYYCRTLDKAPEWDGHTSADVLKRLKKLIG